LIFFFFQAEDGIRGRTVTGVQTCALPILALFVSSVGKFRAAGTAVPANKPTTAIVRVGPYRFSRNPIYLAFTLLQLGIAIWVNRSEERRVGKEWKARSALDP